MILDDGHPVSGYQFMYAGGIDGYDQDESKTSKSLGAMVVLERKHNKANKEDYRPVCLIRTRPKYKEMFYEMCLRVALYYNLQEATNFDVRTAMVAQYIKDSGHESLLAPRPRKFESPNSQQTHEYGTSLNNFSRPRMVGLLQSYFSYNSKKIWFVDIIEEALNFDEVEVGSDNDTVDALGLALMQDISMDNQAFNQEALLANNPFNYPEWDEDSSGVMVDVTSDSNDKPLGVEEDWFSRHARKQLNKSVGDGEDSGFGERNDLYDID
jgi:hypothetical protein